MAELYFPTKGIHKGIRPGAQPEGTSPDLNNVRPYDVLDNRLRGGQRPGLAKLYPEQIGIDKAAIVSICSVTVVD